MADFQSSKTAAEIEEVLTGALLYTKAQPLTEGQKAFVREKIGATELGEGIKIVAHFDTLEELEAAIPNPKVGDPYSIGAELPYDLYVFDALHGEWKNHGPIRANDITARFVQNAPVLVDAWEEDTSAFADYTFKATIPLTELTGRDFPIVAFDPADAVGGNFCPICYAFDGYIEIWARTIPETDINVPAVTYIVMDTENGESNNSTKGITNAGGGIATGGVVNSMLADEAVTADKVRSEARTQYFDVAVGAEWIGEAAPFSQTIAVEGLLESDRAKVRFSVPDSFEELEAQQEAFALLYDAESADGAITLYAKELPGTAFAVVLEVARI